MLARLQRSARYWSTRCGGIVEPDELLAEGWLAWERSGTWIRAEGAMRDRIRVELAHRGRDQDGPDDLAAAPRVQVSVPVRLLRMVERSRHARPASRVTDFARQRRIVAALAGGAEQRDVARREGLSQARISALNLRALRRIEGARIAERRRQAAGVVASAPNAARAVQ